MRHFVSDLDLAAANLYPKGIKRQTGRVSLGPASTSRSRTLPLVHNYILAEHAATRTIVLAA